MRNFLYLKKPIQKKFDIKLLKILKQIFTLKSKSFPQLNFIKLSKIE